MLVMLRKALWDLRWTAFWFGVGGAVYTLLVSFFYPMVREQSKAFTSLVATYPKGLLNALGYTDITTFPGYMGAESLNLFWPIIVAVFATLAGASLVAKEVEDGTSEIWLSIPAERWRLLLGKMGALALALIGIVAMCLIAVELSAVIVSASVSISGLLAMGVVMVAFLVVIAAYTGLLSSVLSSRGAAAGISLGVTVAFYMASLIGGLSDQWQRFKDFSIFTAYKPQKALETGSIDLLPIAILVAISAVCVLLSLYGFQRRDAI
jgi:ABC-2 type transport system permease protein